MPDDDQRGSACECGHSVEEHGHHPEYPGSTECNVDGCDCIAFEHEGQDDTNG